MLKWLVIVVKIRLELARQTLPVSYLNSGHPTLSVSYFSSRSINYQIFVIQSKAYHDGSRFVDEQNE
jgi:hypothetical protein